VSPAFIRQHDGRVVLRDPLDPSEAGVLVRCRGMEPTPKERDYAWARLQLRRRQTRLFGEER